VTYVRAVTMPVSTVLVLEDRAHVSRAGSVELAEGDAWLVVAGVAPALADKTLTAAVTVGAGGLEPTVHDVRVVRERRLRDEDARPDDRLLDERVDAARVKRDRLEASARALRDEAESLEAVLACSLDELAEDAAWARFDRKAAQKTSRALGARLEEVRQGIAEVELELDEARREHAAVEALRAERPRQGIAARLEILLHVPRAGTFDVRASYVVPSACWRPRHVAELVEPQGRGEARVLLRSEASVWQATGEDWSDVELVLSTERPSLGTEPPRLATDRLEVQRKSATLVVEARESEIEAASVVARSAGVPRVAPGMPGIDDGGAVESLRAPQKVRVPCDGRPVRVPLFSLESAAERELLVVGELAEAAVLRTTFVNTSARPLLAGPVELVRRGGFAGRTTMLYVAPGERVALGWGADPTIAVSREASQRDEEQSLVSSWRARTHRVRLRLSHLTGGEVVVWVRERVPVSELEKVQVELVPKDTTGARQPDAHGFLEWRVALGPHARERVKLTYRVRWHSDVSLEAL
jgi:uncharacterized protein (TIGR02231 family)